MRTIVTMEEFSAKAIAYFKENLPETEVKKAQSERNNGMVIPTISIKPNRGNVGFNLILPPLYEEYKEGSDLDDIFRNALNVLRNRLSDADRLAPLKEKLSFTYAKDNVVMVLVNRARNVALLEKVPHRDVLDLSFIYRLVFPDEFGPETVTSTIVTQELLKHWGISSEELFELAKKNTPRIFPPKVETLSEALGMDMPHIPASEKLYIMSNERCLNGAIAMLDTEVLSWIAQKVGADLYILPSSVHEALAVSVDACRKKSAEILAEMVKTVNYEKVLEEEQLSDSVYRFEVATKEITIAAS